MNPVPHRPLPHDLTRAGASALADGIATRSCSSRDVVDAHIARIEAVNPALNAVIAQRFERARADADAADALQRAGAELGPLHGVPITIKEQFAVAGMPTTFGVARAHDDESDGPLVARLRAAGAIVLGKTNVPQLLVYNESDNPVYGRTNNPWDLARSPGGSSGGEAAIVAACGSALGLGSDIGGSLRCPSHFCGIATLKPTSGRLTNEDSRAAGYAGGQIAIVSQPGPMARDVGDLALAMRVLAAAGLERLDPQIAPVVWRDPRAIDLRGVHVALYEDDGYFPASPAVRRAVREAGAVLAGLGAHVETFVPPSVEGAMTTFFGILAADGARSARDRLGSAKRDPRIRGLLRSVQVPNALRPLLSAALRGVGQRGLATQLDAIRPYSTSAFWSLIERQAAYRRRFIAALDQHAFDAIVCPPHALPALTHGSAELLATAASYSMLYNLLGMPAGVVPVTRVRADEAVPRTAGRDAVERKAAAVERGSAGLPIGVQIVARHWREDIVLAVMAALEAGCRARPDYPTCPP